MRESEIIELIRKEVWSQSEYSLNFLDDCARLPPGTGESVITVDALVEGIHFRRQSISAFDLAWKALAVNLSDLNSKGARPCGFLLSISLPRDIQRDWFLDFVQGLNACAKQYQCPLLGGDTTGAKQEISLQITAVGRASQPRWRTGGKAGDILAVTGGLGGSSLGLSVQEGEFRDRSLAPELKKRFMIPHHRPTPHLEEGQWISGFATAMMDLSDGIYRDVQKMAVASRLIAEVDVAKLPWHENAQSAVEKGILSQAEARGFALWGGEDYELLVAIPAQIWNEFSRDFAKRFNRTVTAIGNLSFHQVESEAHDFSKNHVLWQNMVKMTAQFESLKFEHF